MRCNKWLIEQYYRQELCGTQLAGRKKNAVITAAVITAKVQTHLQTCTSCQEWLSFLKSLDTKLSPFPIINQPVSKLENRIISELTPLDQYQTHSNKLNFLRNLFKYFTSYRVTVIFACTSFLISVLVYSKLVTLSRNLTLANVRFEVQVDAARSVNLAGDFNGWNTETHRLKKYDGQWRVDLPLKPGRYQYVFIVDGTRWIPDPHATEFVEDGYGNKNSVLNLTRI